MASSDVTNQTNTNATEEDIVEIPLDNSNSSQSTSGGASGEEDTSVMGWLKWGGEKTLAGVDFVGEFFADLIGITDSKYAYYVAEAEQQKRKEAQRLQKERERTNREIEAAEGGAPVPIKL